MVAIKSRFPEYKGNGVEKRAYAKAAIEHLALEWMHETGYEKKPGHYPSFGDFKTWLESKHKSLYLNFRSRVDPRTEAEGWFEAAIDNYWRARRR